mmetsp:Transcript_89679/g.109779  ORF Transcript_89679/g.109779 Transcript_89679/m.109779 type:complete len:96 (+) Transcript_89679:111-398(+)
MRRTVIQLARPSHRHSTRQDSPFQLPDAAQWALTVGLGTLIPGFALFKLFTVTGAVEAERGAQEELARHQSFRQIANPDAQEAAGHHEAGKSVTV